MLTMKTTQQQSIWTGGAIPFTDICSMQVVRERRNPNLFVNLKIFARIVLQTVGGRWEGLGDAGLAGRSHRSRTFVRSSSSRLGHPFVNLDSTRGGQVR